MTLRYLINGFLILLLTLVFSILALSMLPLAWHTNALVRVTQWWGRALVRACGVEVIVEGPGVALDAPAYLVMANHTSHFDVPCLFGSLPFPVRAVAKKELGWIPFFGWVMVLGAAIMIDRADRKSAMSSLENAGRTIRGGRSVLMFPEGTRTPPGELGELKKGPFHLAQAARVPILPVGLIGTGDVLRKGDWRIRGGRVTMRVGQPIPTADVPTDDAGRAILMARTAEALAGLITPGGRLLDRA